MSFHKIPVYINIDDLIEDLSLIKKKTNLQAQLKWRVRIIPTVAQNTAKN